MIVFHSRNKKILAAKWKIHLGGGRWRQEKQLETRYVRIVGIQVQDGSVSWTRVEAVWTEGGRSLREICEVACRTLEGREAG